MNTNKEFLDYFGKKFSDKDFTIEDLKNDGFIKGLIEQEEISQELEEKNYLLRQINAYQGENDELKEKKESIEKEFLEKKESFKELSGKDWSSTKYNLEKPVQVDYSEMDKKETYYQQRFEQRLDIMLNMVKNGSEDNTLSEKNMNKCVDNFLKLQKQISEMIQQ